MKEPSLICMTRVHPADGKSFYEVWMGDSFREIQTKAVAYHHDAKRVQFFASSPYRKRARA